MPFAALPTVVSGSVITTSWGNGARDNDNYLKSLLDGTGGAVDVVVPSNLFIANDANFGFIKSGSSQIITFDGNDLLYYDRVNNRLVVMIGGLTAWYVGANGRIEGPGLYDSGVVYVSGASVNLTHGFGALPSTVWGVWGTTSSPQTPLVPQGVAAGSVCRINSVNDFDAFIFNDTGSAKYVRLLARR